MDVLLAVAVAVAISLELFGVGIVYGLRRLQLPLDWQATFAATSLLGTLVAGLLGAGVRHGLSAAWANLLGAFLLVLLGLWLLLGSGALRPWPRCIGSSLFANPALFHWSEGRPPRPSRPWLLAVALSRELWCFGLASGLLAWPMLLVLLVGTLLALVALEVGVALGARQGGKRLVERLSVCAACLLLAIGLQQIL